MPCSSHITNLLLCGWIMSTAGEFNRNIKGTSIFSRNRCYRLQPLITALCNGKIWCLDSWSLMGSGRTWRFDCSWCGLHPFQPLHWNLEHIIIMKFQQLTTTVLSWFFPSPTVLVSCYHASSKVNKLPKVLLDWTLYLNWHFMLQANEKYMQHWCKYQGYFMASWKFLLKTLFCGLRADVYLLQRNWIQNCNDWNTIIIYWNYWC